MMNEDKKNEVMETEVVEVEDLNYEPEEIEEDEFEGSGIVGKIAVGVAVVATVTGVGAVVKNWKKLTHAIDEHNAKKLEKKGYSVLRPDDVFQDEDFDTYEDIEEFEGEFDEEK